MQPDEPLRLYTELARWWPLFSPPSHYVEEAADLLPTLLELGCGGGSLAYNLKGSFELTLTDLSPRMLEVSLAANPECAHVPGDMRTLDLGPSFDRGLIHDAITYATEPESVRATSRTAARPVGRREFLGDTCGLARPAMDRPRDATLR